MKRKVPPGSGSPSGRRSLRGSSLIEVLISMVILALLMVGVLQMISMSLLVAQGSGGRTQMTYKAQQVVEQIRFVQYLRRSGRPTAAAGIAASSGIPVTLAVASSASLPYDATDTYWTFWGPNGTNVVEEAKGPYRLSYSVSDVVTNGVAFWIVTVTATAQDSQTAPAGAHVFMGTGMGNKRIDYVAEIPKI